MYLQIIKQFVIFNAQYFLCLFVVVVKESFNDALIIIAIINTSKEQFGLKVKYLKTSDTDHNS